MGRMAGGCEVLDGALREEGRMASAWIMCRCASLHAHAPLLLHAKTLQVAAKSNICIITGKIKKCVRCYCAHRVQGPVPVQSGAHLPMYKTKLCQPFMMSGECSRGDQCSFAHGPQELRSGGPPPGPPMGGFPPVSPFQHLKMCTLQVLC